MSDPYEDIRRRVEAASPDRITPPSQWRQKNSKPIRKARYSAAVAAVMTLLVFALNAFTGVHIPEEVATSATTVATVITIYVTRPDEADQIVRETYSPDDEKR